MSSPKILKIAVVFVLVVVAILLLKVLVKIIVPILIVLAIGFVAYKVFWDKKPPTKS